MDHARGGDGSGLKLRARFPLRCLAACLFALPVATEANERLAAAYGHIERVAPRRDWIGGGFTTFFGVLALETGAGLLSDSRSTAGERNVGRLLLAVNAVRVADGVRRLTTSRESERDALAFRTGVLSNPIGRLAGHETHYRTLRLWRAHLVLVTALSYLHLATSGKPRHAEHAGSGAFLLGVAAFQYWRLSPEEEAARSFFGAASALGTRVHVTLLPEGPLRPGPHSDGLAPRLILRLQGKF